MKPTLLHSYQNRYRGRWVQDNLTDDIAQFAIDLEYSLSVWQAEGIKVVWLPITTDKATLISIAVAQGFAFHHVSGSTLTLTRRLIEDAAIPEFAHHTLGVGGIVFNHQNQILTIIEKQDMQTRPGHWKFPGGAVDKGEFIRDAIVREVREETAVESEFVNMVGMRHYHKGQFATSNLYIVCRLQAQTETIMPCPEEIGMAKWVDVDEYLACETVLNFNKKLLQAAMTGHGMPDVNIGDLHGTTADNYEIFTAFLPT